MTDNPLKNLSDVELIQFAQELDEYADLLHSIYENHADSSQGILDPYGLALLRALYVCVLKLYTDKNIMTLRDIARDKTGFKLSLDNYVTDVENFGIGVFDPYCLEEQMEDEDGYAELFSNQIFGEISIGGDIYDLSRLDGIGDFVEIELPVDSAYEFCFGTDNEEAEEDEVPDEDKDIEKIEADFPDFFREYFMRVAEDYETYFFEVVSFSVCRSKKIGRAVEFLKKKGYDKEKIEEVPLLDMFVSCIEMLCTKNLFYDSSYNGDLVENEEWFGYTLATGNCEDTQTITIFQRLPGIKGFAYVVQEIADRILDGRFQC